MRRFTPPTRRGPAAPITAPNTRCRREPPRVPPSKRHAATRSRDRSPNMSLDLGTATGSDIPAGGRLPGPSGELPPGHQLRRRVPLPAFLGPGVVRAVVLACVGYLFGHWFGNAL